MKLCRLSCVVVVLVLVACASPPVPQATMSPPARVGGYLTNEQLPDSVKLVPPPPAEGSAAFAQDQAVQRNAFAMRGTPRWDLAALDAKLSPPAAAGVFSCALGIAIDPESTPRLQVLLYRSILDSARSTGNAKRLYQRTRPFAKNAQPTCAPGDEETLRRDGSYPSGHTAAGMGGALVLSQVAPDRVNELMARGRSFGESRLVCNYHWQSDLIAGRHVAAATVARLQSVPEFQQDVEAARKEYEAARKRGAGPGRDCDAEARALALAIPEAQ